MKYRFVLIDNGWWLKISTIEELKEYWKQTALKSPFASGLRSFLNCREFGKPINGESIRPHVNTAGLAIGLYSHNREISPLCAAVELETSMYQNQANEIIKGNDVYFNRNGGYHSGKDKIDQWYDSDKLVFPDFCVNQIKIEKFPMGKHYYAFIDSMQVRDGDILKWDTYEEAYNQALKIINEEH